MLALALLLVAAADPAAHAPAHATVTILRGERIDFGAPRNSPDVQVRQVPGHTASGAPARLDLVEFQ